MGATVPGIGLRRRSASRSPARQHAHQGPSFGQRRASAKKKTGAKEVPRAIGSSRGGRNTKVHLIADAHGKPKVICLTAGHRHDIVPAQAMLATLPPDVRVIADAAYDCVDLRDWLAQRQSRVVIPNRKTAESLIRSMLSPTGGATSWSGLSVASRIFAVSPCASIVSMRPSSLPSASPPASHTSSSSQLSLGPRGGTSLTPTTPLLPPFHIAVWGKLNVWLWIFPRPLLA